MLTNFVKTLVWKHGNDVKLWRHKQRTPNAHDHHMTLNQNPPIKLFCVRHCYFTIKGTTSMASMENDFRDSFICTLWMRWSECLTACKLNFICLKQWRAIGLHLRVNIMACWHFGALLSLFKASYSAKDFLFFFRGLFSWSGKTKAVRKIVFPKKRKQNCR